MKKHLNFGAKEQAGSIMLIAIASFVFAVIYIGLAAGLSAKRETEVDLHLWDDLQRSVVVFGIFVFATVIGLLVLVSPLYNTLKKEGKLTTLSIVCCVMIWVFSVFYFVIFVINMLTAANLANWSKEAELVCNVISILAPLLFLVFGTLLFVDVRKSYLTPIAISPIDEPVIVDADEVVARR